MTTTTRIRSTLSFSLAGRRAESALKVAGVVGFALLTALAAQATVPIPGTPVPMTLQSLSVTLAALTLGGRLGALSMSLYLLLGMAGLPVYADASGGLHTTLGATGGYLLGFILAQPIMARAARTRTGAYAGWKGLVAALVLGHAVIFALGVFWLKIRLGFDWASALDGGLWPFLPGTLIKGAAAFFLGLIVTPRTCLRG
ncbi:MAG: biotin transporter BioY [Deltaproteobacteria bacterium HGW-Deltaproteobacteria-17]|nr:MAG: biotin transporter BioY [Deltaproteobacteria bacterium HGW-Deltaproteobacteria-17]